jgi:uncharacterized repeat protein (TIGR01451 family)/fimbrial isopeptide formation D2 family protein
LFNDKKLTGCSRFLAKVIIAGSVFLCLAGNAIADLQITKEIDPVSPSPAAENDVVRYNLSVTNTGADLGRVTITDIPENLTNLNFTVTSANPPPGNPLGSNQYRFNNLPAGETVTLNLDATVDTLPAVAGDCPVINNIANVSDNTGTIFDSATAPGIEYDFGFTSGIASNVISHVTLTSYCEFCDTGLVTIRITNPTSTPLTNIVLQENLQSLGLTYINGTTSASIGGANNPSISGGGTILTWDQGDIPALGSLAVGATLDVSFRVSTYDEAQILADPNRDIIASVTFGTDCTTGPHTAASGQFELPIRQPRPQVFKQGRNYDANQNDWQNTVYGNFNDDIIWRVLVRNLGDANMEALRINDSITGNFSINYICPTLGDANDVGLNNGVAPGGSPCVSMASPFNVADPFGSAADPDDIGTGGSRDGFFYYVGRVLNNHTDETNTADVSWGCATESPTGGLITTPASVNGSTPPFDIDDTADLETTVTTNGLQVTQTVTGINTTQDLGARGIVTITLNNQTGGSIQNLEVTASLPAGYVVDNTYGPGAGLSPGDPNYGQPTSTQAGAYGAYDGFIDTVTRDDAALLTADPLDDLIPHFTLTSTGPPPAGADAAQQVDMMREDDVITIRFGIIMTDPAGSRFDLVADLDVNEETVGDGTDPASELTLSNTVTVDFDAVDPAGPQNLQRIVNFNNIDADPEDLDVDISDALFILTNDPGVPLNLNVILTNNGGHDADNYTVYVTLGEAMTAQMPYPSGCIVTSNPPPHPVWNDPAFIPASAEVFACDRGTIAPGTGNAETITFSVVKSGAPVFDDDLTFRADVVGEIHYADSTPGTPNPLLDPAPASIPSTTPNLQLANNYSLDGIRSRVLGFNLVQSAWYCAEDGFAEPTPPPADILSPVAAPPNLPMLTGNLNSQIGEDCAFRIESGGWFGFLTPGFTLIAVQDVEVRQDLPENLPSATNEGQGFIPFDGLGTPYNINKTDNIILDIDANGGATTTPLDNNDIIWRFNTASGISVKDEFFRVDLKTRMLNDPVDGLYPVPGSYTPNLHGRTSTAITRTSFNAIFNSPTGDITIPVDDSSGIPGYPDIDDRTVDQIEVEPDLIVTKQVCNESLYDPNPVGSRTGVSCTNFVDLADDGDTNDEYVYRITLTNENNATVRSPAFNITSTDILDSSDLMLVLDFETDGLDNDGDGEIDETDEATLFASIPDNNIGIGGPAEITIDETYNSGPSPSFERLDAGDSITFYYRVDPDITIAPLQTLTNTVDMTYDSLDADSGNQSVPQYDNLENTAPNIAGRARIYNSRTQTADVQMIPLVAQPMAVIAKSNTPMNAPPFPPATPEEVSVGEEIRYQMVALLPVANLREFRIRNELPQGLSCVELQAVSLSTTDFSPGGPPLTTTCTQSTDASRDVVEWYFGEQAVISSPPGNRLLFPINFVARVENTTFVNAQTITNGGNDVDPATCSTAAGSSAAVCYQNDSFNDVALNFQEVDVVVREPAITLTKSFDPVVNSDAGDILTVTVTAENTVVTDTAGAGAAYNLQVLDDLTSSDLTYMDNSMDGPDAPDDDGVTADSKLPRFTWLDTNPDYEILTGDTKTFTFQVRVDTTAQPLEILDNTIEAKWDSLPGQGTALNATGNIGIDGSALGLRNGKVPIPSPNTDVNDYETTASDSTSVPALTMSKSEVGSVINTIGAHRHFEVVIDLPEGTTNNLVVEDDLSFGGTSYSLSRNASFDITYTFQGIAEINLNTTPSEGAFTDVTTVVDNATGTLSWNIGTVVTNAQDDQTIPPVDRQIIINYYARPNNDVTTNDGDNMQNTATVTYNDGETGLVIDPPLNDTTVAQTVVEPVLTISKVVSNFTNDGVAPVAGDVLEYIITIEHDAASTSDAFDITVTDNLDANLAFDGTTPATAAIDTTGVVGFNSTPAVPVAGRLVWGRGNADNTLDLLLGEQLVLTYYTVVQNTIEANVDISNSALVDWTSLDDSDLSNTFERRGDNDGVSCASVTAPDEYCAGPVFSTINSNDTNSISKRITDDTYNEPPLSDATDAIVRVGDIATYQVDINLQAGTTDNVIVRDTIPAGMELVDIVSINGDTTAPYDPRLPGNPGSNFSYASITAGNFPVTGARDAISWNIGTVVNDAGGDATTDSLAIIYRLRVVENEPAFTIIQQPETDLVNTAELDYDDGLGNPPATLPSSTATLTVRQPEMDDLDKTERTGRPNNVTVDVTTDVMEFRLHTCNTDGEARAYGLQIIDQLPSEMDETSITGPTNGALAPDVYIDGVLVDEGAANAYVYSQLGGRGGTMQFDFNTPIDPDVCVDIDFNMGFYTDFGANVSWDNEVRVNEYYSLPAPPFPATGQLYPVVGPAIFSMNNFGGTFAPPVKTVEVPDLGVLPHEVTIGDIVTYHIAIPAQPGIMFDVTIRDILPPQLEYIPGSAQDIDGNNFSLTETLPPGVPAGEVRLVIDQMLVGQTALIQLQARVINDAGIGATNTFTNTAELRYANVNDGPQAFIGSDTSEVLTIVEPELAVGKSVENINKSGLPPDAGDILRYTVTLTAAGGGVSPADFNSNAYDVSITDDLSLGLAYNGNLSVSGGKFIDTPDINVGGDGINTPQVLSWSETLGNADIDVTEGTSVTVSYDVIVVDEVVADQDLTNSVDIQWSSRDGPDVNERDGSGGNVPPGLAYNDYFSDTPATTSVTTPDNTTVTKTRLADTFGAGDNIVRIGDIIDYQLRVSVQEGTSPNFVIEDELNMGLAFEETVSINGQTSAPYVAVAPFSHSAITAPATAGDPTSGTSTVTWNIGDLVNTGDNVANDDFVIIYRARVLNLVHPPANNIPLNNTVDVDYIMDGSNPAPTKTDSELLDLQQPDLSVTTGSAPANGSVIGAGDLVTFTVDVLNNGATTAYDTSLRVVVPMGMRNADLNLTNVSLTSGTPILPPPVLPQLIDVDDATGVAIIDFDTGSAGQFDIPAGDTLQVVYEVSADAGLGAGATLLNESGIQFYYSFDDDATPSVVAAIPPPATIDGVREIYGPVASNDITFSTTPANPLEKVNPADLDASIGEEFTYTITVPAATQTTALYDVQIIDDLNLSAADLALVSITKVSGSLPWTPQDIGTVPGVVVIADPAVGIDIPANEQVEIEVTVVLLDNSPPNDAPLTFDNTATYTFNQLDGIDTTVSAGSGNSTSPVMNVVEPDLTMDKRGPAGTVNFATPIPYTVVVENIGTGPAFDTTIIDQLPDVPDNAPLTGGTCDSSPINFDARITTAANEAVVVRALAPGVDYTVTHTAAPTCELQITTLTDMARVEAGEKLIVSYEAILDVASQSGALLTNVAGVTQYFSLDTPAGSVTGEIREYTNTFDVGNPGTPGTTDHEDAVQVTVEAPILDVSKSVVNTSTGQTPGTNAVPGEILQYTITVTNNGAVDATGVTMIDLVPADTTYVANTVLLNGNPVGQPDGGVSPLIAGIDISSSDLTPPLPGAGNGVITVGETATVTFDVLLDPVITSGTIISNQAVVDSPSTGPLLSDDPNVGGVLDPTTTLVTSAPAFQVQKVSQDVTSDPAILMPGDTLRYTLTVKNVGQEDAINSLLSDQVPANTTYVADSVTLNGLPVGQPDGGVSPLIAGIAINAPENTTAGYLRADTDAAADNVATVTFDVVVNLTAVNGTIISNQGFINGEGAGSGMFPQQPSDDPATALVDDPTIDVVGNVPVVDSLKTVVLQDDADFNGIVTPGDTLRYTIITTNIGALPATNVVLTDDLDDPVAGQIMYVPGSGLLDGLPAGVSFDGVSILTVTIGDLLPASSAVVIFDVVVNAGVVASAIISNQGYVASNELPTEPTDADGNDANGDQPTIVVVGNVQQLAITKEVLVIGGGAAEPGKELEYVVRVTNIGSITATNVVITDDMDLPLPDVIAGQKTYVDDSGLLDGISLPAGSFSGSLLTVNVGDLPAAAVTELRFRVLLDTSLVIGTTVTNRADVTWDEGTSFALVSIDIGGVPGSANLNGQVWHDADFSNDIGTGETLLQDYRVELYLNNTLLANTLTDADGVFQFTGLPPNTSVDPYEVRYLAPGAVAATATLGTTSSPFTDGPQRITEIVVVSGDNVQNMNLPRRPNGVVYDSVLRVPVAGVRLTMINQTRSNQPVPEECFGDGTYANQADQVTLADGYYKFDLNFSVSGRCEQGDEYEIQIQPPADDFTGTTSVIIPPVVPVTDAAFDVPSCPGMPADKIPATSLICENSDSNLQPPASVAPRTAGTDYNLKFLFSNVPGTPFTDQIYNNHIPVDGVLEAAVAISKVAGKLNVTRSDLVPYTITFNNTLGVPLFDVSVIDNFPAGFKYVTGSARVDGAEIEPEIDGRYLTWPGLSVGINESRVIKLLLVVGSGVGEGEYVNTARAINTLTGGDVSGVASATVRVIPDPTFDCTDVIGKVFDDKNLNSYQDQGERGIPGVQVATARGLRVTTDSNGRFHITCAIVANEVRGSNFIMKLDDRTLPSGYRVTTENPRVQRATRGKMLKFNFGTAIHRVVRLDLADGVFEKGSTELRPQWESRIELLITELQKEGSILRLSYLGENESEDEVENRLDAIEDLISDRWQQLDCCYKLTIEQEVFWRKGSPSERKRFE